MWGEENRHSDFSKSDCGFFWSWCVGGLKDAVCVWMFCVRQLGLIFFSASECVVIRGENKIDIFSGSVEVIARVKESERLNAPVEVGAQMYGDVI